MKKHSPGGDCGKAYSLQVTEAQEMPLLWATVVVKDSEKRHDQNQCRKLWW